MKAPPTYYARNGTVRKASVHTKQANGSTSMTLDFPVCTMTSIVGDEAAETLAALMNAGEENFAKITPTNDSDYAFFMGDTVEKYTGDYFLTGIVVARFKTLVGCKRYVVEHVPLAPGMLHIYSEANLRRTDKATEGHRG